MKTFRKTLCGLDLEFQQTAQGILVHLENHQFIMKRRKEAPHWMVPENMPPWLRDLEEPLNKILREITNKH